MRITRCNGEEDFRTVNLTAAFGSPSREVECQASLVSPRGTWCFGDTVLRGEFRGVNNNNGFLSLNFDTPLTLEELERVKGATLIVEMGRYQTVSDGRHGSEEQPDIRLPMQIKKCNFRAEDLAKGKTHCWAPPMVDVGLRMDAPTPPLSMVEEACPRRRFEPPQGKKYWCFWLSLSSCRDVVPNESLSPELEGGLDRVQGECGA